MFFINSSNLAHTLSIYEKVVAPSASTMRILSPWATDIPALTAPPFPLFLGYSTTISGTSSYLAFLSATSVVLSFDPSFAIMISYFLPDFFKCLAVSSNITGSLYSSLYDGTTKERSTICLFFYMYYFFDNFTPSAPVIVMASYCLLSKFFFQFL